MDKFNSDISKFHKHSLMISDSTIEVLKKNKTTTNIALEVLKKMKNTLSVMESKNIEHKIEINPKLKEVSIKLDELSKQIILSDPSIILKKNIDIIGQEDENEYANRISDVITSIKDISSRQLSLNISPDKVGFYVALQKEIARRIPLEEQRPTIQLKIRSNKRDQNNSKHIGILGGTGPLSDAAILEKVMESLVKRGVDLDNVAIDILSAPPPRGGALKQPQKTARYVNRTRNFMKNQELSHIYLASNTAHLNIGKAKMLSDRPNKIQNLVAGVVESIRNDDKVNSNGKKNVLVLGTQQAFEKNLYPSYLNKEGIDSTVLNSKQAYHVQEMIDRIKSGADPEEYKTAFQEIIQQYIDKNEDNPISHVILGCTELPLITSLCDLFQKNQQFENVQLEDTEHHFAEIIGKTISEQIKNLSEKSFL